ncbi:hypothetical protein ACVOMV_09310 [Mesorhizobium atlanticum]
MMEKVALSSERITEAAQLPGALARAFAPFLAGAAGPGPYRDPHRRHGQARRRHRAQH